MATSWSTLHTSKIVQPPPSSSSQPKASGSGNRSSKGARPKLPMMPDPHSPAKPKQTHFGTAIDTAMDMDMGDLAGSSRSSSLAGRKRPREPSDGNSNGSGNGVAAGALGLGVRVNRRTKSVGDTRPRSGHGSGRERDRDREAFQRGLIAVFVPKALRDSASKGDMTNYNDLLAHFLPTATSPDAPALPPLLPLLRAISAHVSLLHPEVHSGLVSAIIDLPWALGDERFVKTFVGWAGVLVSAHPAWTKEVVQMACRGLAWREFCPLLPSCCARLTWSRAPGQVTSRTAIAGIPPDIPRSPPSPPLPPPFPRPHPPQPTRPDPRTQIPKQERDRGGPDYLGAQHVRVDCLLSRVGRANMGRSRGPHAPDRCTSLQLWKPDPQKEKRG